MGIKRPLDDEELQELPFKNSRQFGYSNKPNQFADTVPHLQVEDGFPKYPWDKPFEADAKYQWDKPFEADAKYQWDKPFEADAINYVTHFLDKDFETSAPLSLVTSTSSDEDSGTGIAAISPVSPEFFDSEFPHRTSAVVDDVYSLLLDRSPRRQVPLGPNHQAYVPSWSSHLTKDKFVRNDASVTTVNDNEKRLMGTCVIPMPDSDVSANNSDKVGAGRTDCSCLDSGSLRCVQQHVMEAREKLKKSLGHEKFVKLGFYDMGEDVAYKWTGEDEEIFREVVYSNPVSLGKKFWKQLSVVFPSLSKRELVSYYFNVFILQRRAVQNRSSILDIDSDDDEWQGSKQTYEVQASEEDEDSDIDSFADQEDLANPEQPQVIEDDEDNDDSGATTEGYSASHFFTKPYDEGRSDPDFQHASKVSGIGEDFNVQDDSCMSFEFQPNLVDSHSLGDNETDLHVSGVKTDLNKSFQQVKQDGPTSEPDPQHVYLYDSCDARIWDARYPTAPTKGIDLQPTCNIIEEIFGQDTCDNKMKNE